MHFSTLTVVVFVAHTSTQAIAAPLPFSDEIQELVARADKHASSPGRGNAHPSSPSENWSKAASSAARAVPPHLLNVPLRSNVASVIQAAVSAAAKANPPQQQPRGRAHPDLGTHGRATQKTPTAIENAMKKSGDGRRFASKPAAARRVAKVAGKGGKVAGKGPKLRARGLEIDELD